MSVSATFLAVMMLADTSATAPKAANADENKLICRRELKTGSMVSATRRCHTKKEWSRMTDATARAARDYVENAQGVNTSN